MNVDAHDTDSMFALLYAELRRLARREAARAGADAPLGATTLLHEAYLDLAQRDSLSFPDEARFLSYAARAMRTIIIDRIRTRNAQKRGGDLHITVLDTETAESIPAPESLSDIGVAIDELAAVDAELANLVDLKFFCGFSVAEIAALRKVSLRTVERQWEKARALLYGLLTKP